MAHIPESSKRTEINSDSLGSHGYYLECFGGRGCVDDGGKDEGRCTEPRRIYANANTITCEAIQHAEIEKGFSRARQNSMESQRNFANPFTHRGHDVLEAPRTFHRAIM